MQTTDSPVLARDGNETLVLMGSTFVLRATGEQTAGVCAVVEKLLQQGMATPLHVQPEDEMFYVLEGVITAYRDGVLATAETGDMIFLPAGTPRAYQVRSEHARVLAFSVPAGHEGFYRLVGTPVDAVSAEHQDPAPPDIEELAAAAAQAGFQVLGPPPFEDS